MIKRKLVDFVHLHLYRKSYSRALFGLWGQVIQECKVSFTQFFTLKHPIKSVARIVIIFIINLLRLIFLGRSLRPSYSFTGEDRIIDALLKRSITKPGLYVDVGCNHPIFLSNTYLFYKRGWRGVCIDANDELINKFSWFRPKDTAICALVSDHNDVQQFYKLTNDVLSTTEGKLVAAYQNQGQVVETTKMQPRSLTNILDSVSFSPFFDILSIDTEEHDFNVLKSLDLNRYHPKIIILEVSGFNLRKPQSDDVFQYLLSYGYTFEGYILKNAYFKKLS